MASFFERIREQEAQQQLEDQAAFAEAQRAPQEPILPTSQDLVRGTQGLFSRSVALGGNQAQASFEQLRGNTAEADEIRNQLAGTGSEVQSFRDVNDLSSAAEFATGLAGQTVGALLPAAAGGVVAAAASPLLPIAAPVAAALGSAAVTAPQFTGENLLAQRDAGVAEEDLSFGRAATTAVGQTALDTIGVGKFLGRAGKAAAKTVNKVPKTLGQRVRNVGKEIGAQALEESIPEALQGVLQNIQTQGLEGAREFTSKELVDQAIEDAVAGAILGGGLGGATGSARNIREAAGKRNKVSEILNDETSQPTDIGSVPIGDSVGAVPPAVQEQPLSTQVPGGVATAAAPGAVTSAAQPINLDSATIREGDRDLTNDLLNRQYDAVVIPPGAKPDSFEAAALKEAKKNGVLVNPKASKPVSQGGTVLLSIPEARQSSPDFYFKLLTPIAESGSDIHIPRQRLETTEGSKAASVLTDSLGYSFDQETSTFTPAFKVEPEVVGAESDGRITPQEAARSIKEDFGSESRAELEAMGPGERARALNANGPVVLPTDKKKAKVSPEAAASIVANVATRPTKAPRKQARKATDTRSPRKKAQDKRDAQLKKLPTKTERKLSDEAKEAFVNSTRESDKDRPSSAPAFEGQVPSSRKARSALTPSDKADLISAMSDGAVKEVAKSKSLDALKPRPVQEAEAEIRTLSASDYNAILELSDSERQKKFNTSRSFTMPRLIGKDVGKLATIEQALSELRDLKERSGSFFPEASPEELQKVFKTAKPLIVPEPRKLNELEKSRQSQLTSIRAAARESAGIGVREDVSLSSDVDEETRLFMLEKLEDAVQRLREQKARNIRLQRRRDEERAKRKKAGKRKPIKKRTTTKSLDAQAPRPVAEAISEIRAMSDFERNAITQMSNLDRQEFFNTTKPFAMPKIRKGLSPEARKAFTQEDASSTLTVQKKASNKLLEILARKRPKVKENIAERRARVAAEKKANAALLNIFEDSSQTLTIQQKASKALRDIFSESSREAPKNESRKDRNIRLAAEKKAGDALLDIFSDPSLSLVPLEGTDPGVLRPNNVTITGEPVRSALPEVVTEQTLRSSVKLDNKPVTSVPDHINVALELLDSDIVNSLSTWVKTLDAGAINNLETLMGINKQSVRLDSALGTKVEQAQRDTISYLQQAVSGPVLQEPEVDFDFSEMFDPSQTLDIMESTARSVEQKLLDVMYPALGTSEFPAAVSIYNRILNGKTKELKTLLQVGANRDLAIRLQRQIEAGSLSTDQEASLNFIDPEASLTPKGPFVGVMRTLVRGSDTDVLKTTRLQRRDFQKAYNQLLTVMTNPGTLTPKGLAKRSPENKLRVLLALKEMADPESSFAKFAEKKGGVSIEAVESVTQNLDWNSIENETVESQVSRKELLEGGMDTLSDPESMAAWDEEAFGPDFDLNEFTVIEADTDLSRLESLIDSSLKKIENSEGEINQDVIRSHVQAEVIGLLQKEGAFYSGKNNNLATVNIPGLGQVFPSRLYALSKDRQVAQGSDVAMEQAARNLNALMSLMDIAAVPMDKRAFLLSKPDIVLYEAKGRKVLVGEVAHGTGSRQHLKGIATDMLREQRKKVKRELPNNQTFYSEKGDEVFSGVMPRHLSRVIRDTTGKGITRQPGRDNYVFKDTNRVVRESDVIDSINKFLADTRGLKTQTQASPAETFYGWANDKYKAHIQFLKKFDKWDNLQGDIKKWKEEGPRVPIHPLEARFGFIEPVGGVSFEKQLIPLWKKARKELFPQELTDLRVDIKKHYASKEYRFSDPIVQSMSPKHRGLYIQYKELGDFFRQQDTEIMRFEMERPGYIDREGFGLSQEFGIAADFKAFGVAAEDTASAKSLRTEMDLTNADFTVESVSEFVAGGRIESVLKSADKVLKASSDTSPFVVDMRATALIEQEKDVLKTLPGATTTFVKLVEKEAGFTDPYTMAGELAGRDGKKLYTDIKRHESLKSRVKPTKRQVSAALQARGLASKGVNPPVEMAQALDANRISESDPVIIVTDGDFRGLKKLLDKAGTKSVVVTTKHKAFVSQLSSAIVSLPNVKVVYTSDKAKGRIDKVFGDVDIPPVKETDVAFAIEEAIADTAIEKGVQISEVRRSGAKNMGDFKGALDNVMNRKVEAATKAKAIEDASFVLQDNKTVNTWAEDKTVSQIQNKLLQTEALARKVLTETFGQGQKVAVTVPILEDGKLLNPIQSGSQAALSSVVDPQEGTISLEIKISPELITKSFQDILKDVSHEVGHSVVYTNMLSKTPEAEGVLTAMYLQYISFLQTGANSNNLPRPFAQVKGLDGETINVDSILIDSTTLEPDMASINTALGKSAVDQSSIAAHATYMASFHEWAADRIGEQLRGRRNDPVLRAALAHVTGLHGQQSKLVHPIGGEVKEAFVEEIELASRGLDIDPDLVATEWWSRQVAMGNIADVSFVHGMAEHLDNIFDEAAARRLRNEAWRKVNRDKLVRFIKESFPEESRTVTINKFNHDAGFAAAMFIQAVSIRAIEPSNNVDTFLSEAMETVLNKMGKRSSDGTLRHLTERFSAAFEAKDAFTVFDLNPKLKETTINRVIEKVDKAAEVLEDRSRFFWQGTSQRLRALNNPHINRIVDLFTPEPGSNEIGYFVEQPRRMNEFVNLIGEDLDVLSEAELESVNRALQLDQRKNSNLVNQLPPRQRKLANKIRKTLGKVKVYLQEAGVGMGDLGPKYFPIVFEPEWFLKNRTEILSRLTNKHQADLLKLAKQLFPNPEDRDNFPDPDDMAYAVATRIVDGVIEAGGLLDDSEVLNRGATYISGFRFANTRLLDFIFSDPDTAQWMQNGMSTDVSHTVIAYIKGATKRAELTRRLGVGNANSNLTKWLEQALEFDPDLDVDEVMKGLDAYSGIIGIRTNEAIHRLIGRTAPEGQVINPTLRKVSAATTSIVYTQILALSPIIALTDVMGILTRTGDLDGFARAVFSGMRSLTESGRVDNRGEELATMLGNVTNTVIADLMQLKFDTTFTSGWPQRAIQAFFKVTGMVAITRATKVAATAASEQFLIKHVVNQGEHSARYLNELRVTPEDIRTKLSENRKKIEILTDGERASASKEDLARDDRIRSALVQLTDSMTLRPDAGVQPVWFADPHFALGKMLKSFTYTFYYNILYRVIHEAKHGNLTPVMMAGAYIPAMIMATALQDIIKGYDDPEWRVAKDGLMGYTVDMANKAGLFGPLGFVNDLAIGYEYSGAWGVAGGVLGPWTSAVKNGYNAIEGEGDEAIKGRLGLLPFGNVIKPWWMYD